MRYFGYTLIALGALVLLGMFVGRRLRDAARVVEQASDQLGDDICRHGVCPHECPSCRPMPSVVAGSDFDPLEVLYRAPAFNAERAFRVPGEER